MKAAGGYAFGNVRVRARKEGLLGPDVAARIAAARDRASVRAVVAELGVRGAGGEDVRRSLFPALVDDYRTVMASYPVGGALVLALLRRHEAENLKLVIRACANDVPSGEWLPFWLPLGTLEALRREEWAELRTLEQVREHARGTPYEEVVESSVTTTATSMVSAELSLGAWVSRQIATEALALPDHQGDARDLALLLVSERDSELWSRHEAFGIARELVPATVAFPNRPTAAKAELRRARFHACRRAFIGSPFRLAPALAFLLLREEELKGLTALLEGWRRTDHAAEVREALAASALGGLTG